MRFFWKRPKPVDAEASRYVSNTFTTAPRARETVTLNYIVDRLLANHRFRPGLTRDGLIAEWEASTAAGAPSTERVDLLNKYLVPLPNYPNGFAWPLAPWSAYC